MTLIELQSGTAIDPAAVIGVKRADYHQDAGHFGRPGTLVHRTQVDCTHGRTYLVGVDFDEALRLLSVTEEEPPARTDVCEHGQPFGWVCSGCGGPARRIDLRPHSRACGILAHTHGTACKRDCPTCGGRTAEA